MPRGLIPLLVLSTPAGWDFEMRRVARTARQSAEEGRRPVTLWVADRVVGEGTWLSSSGRLHLALRNPLGQPRAVLRVSDGVASFEWVGEMEVVSLDAASVLSEWVDGLSGPSGVVDLVEGRLPRTPDALNRTADGWDARLGGLVASLDRDGRLVEAWSADDRHRFGVRIRGDQRTVVFDDVDMVVELGALEVVDIPERAFAIGESDRRTVSLHRLARGLERRWLGVSAR